MAAAAEFHLRQGTVLDGEAVIWADGRLSFDHRHQRLVRRASHGVAPGPPASYVAFDVLALDADDQRRRPYTARRQRLERLAAGWAPPMHLCPSTSSRERAFASADDYRAAGIEGLVIKPAASRYPAGRSDWIKVKNRTSREVIIGAVTGPITALSAVIAGLFRAGDLVIAGRTSLLTVAQSPELAALLRPASDDHPWPDQIASGVFGQRQRVAITRVQPQLVLEVAADPATSAGRYRHTLRYLRPRPDLDPAEVDVLT